MSEGREEREGEIKTIDVPEGAIICNDYSFKAIKRVVVEDREQLPSTMEVDTEGARWFGSAAREEWVPTIRIGKGPRCFFDENKSIIGIPETPVSSGVSSGQEE